MIGGVHTGAGPCPQIVSFYDAFVDPLDASVSIVVEYMDGGSLQDIVDTGGCRCEGVLANIAHRVLLGLVFLDRERQVGGEWGAVARSRVRGGLTADRSWQFARPAGGPRNERPDSRAPALPRLLSFSKAPRFSFSHTQSTRRHTQGRRVRRFHFYL